MTTSPGNTLEEAAKAVELHKIHKEKFFSDLGKPPSFEGMLCSGIHYKGGFEYNQVKELCRKLVHHLEKLSKSDASQRTNYCSYIRYWLFEKIGEIYTRETASIDDVPFFNELIDAWTFINAGILKKTCNPDRIKDVKLNELKNRIFSYIYFKNIVNIKNVIASGKKADCDKYLTYLNSFKEVHDGYKNEHCEKSGVPSLNGTDYFSCNDKGELASLINKLEECKSAEKPNPETVPAITASDKGDFGQTPPGGQKVSDGATRPTDSAVVASSSSSSDTETTTTTTTVISTQPATTTTTSATPSKLITSAPSITTTAETVATTNTGTTKSTRSSGGQGEPSILSRMWGFFSSGRPQTSSSSSRTSGSRAPASSMTTTSASSVRGSPVTVTTNTSSSLGSISSTGQVSQGKLTRPVIEGVKYENSLSPRSQGNSGYALHTVSSYNSNSGGDTNPATIADVPGTSEKLYDKLDSNTIKNMIMAAAVLGIIFFLFYYNRSSRLESSIKPKKRKKKKIEHNYYEEYEKELEMYGSEETFLDSETSRLYLNYHPDQDSYY